MSPVRASFAIIALAAAPACGQGVTVQQPTFESFSVGTTVSVPDRGRVSLGGVGRASGGRYAGGFLPGGGATGRGVAASSMDAGVFIHDFDAMDAAVLSSASGSAPRPTYTKSRYSDATSYAMHHRAEASGRRQPAGASPPPVTTRSEPAEQRRARPAALDDADRLLALGDAAARRGEPGVAKLHYRLAAEGGSAEAKRRLATLVTDGERTASTAVAGPPK